MLKYKRDVKSSDMLSTTVREFDYAEHLGKNIYKLAFVCNLVDPSCPVSRKSGDSGTGLATQKAIGAQFKVLEPILIPVAPPMEDFKRNLMSYDRTKITWRIAEAGEVINLTPFEYTLLLCQPEFNGVCLGGDFPVMIKCTSCKEKVNKILPRVSLIPVKEGGVIKDMPVLPIIMITTEVNPITGQVKKITEVREGFEKWNAFAIKPSSRRKTVALNAEDQMSTLEYYTRIGKHLPKDKLKETDLDVDQIIAQAKELNKQHD